MAAYRLSAPEVTTLWRYTNLFISIIIIIIIMTHVTDCQEPGSAPEPYAQ